MAVNVEYLLWLSCSLFLLILTAILKRSYFGLPLRNEKKVSKWMDHFPKVMQPPSGGQVESGAPDPTARVIHSPLPPRPGVGECFLERAR